MSDSIHSQYDFFKNVRLDADGNLLVSIVGGVGATFTGGTINDLTATGNTVVGNFTAGTIYSGATNLYDIFLTSAPDGDITRVQPGSNISTGGTANAPIISLIDSPSVNNLTFSGTIDGSAILIGSNLTMSNNTNSAIIASNNSDIRKSEESGIFASLSSDIANTERSAIIASEASNIGFDTGTSTGAKNSIISSSNSFIDANLPSSSANNNSIIASSGVTIFSTSTLERAVVLGMNNYTASTPGVHVENLIIKSGATAGYIWTAVDSSGRGEWRGGTTNTGYTYDSIGLAVSDEVTELTTGNTKLSFRLPYDFQLTGITAYIGTSGSTDTIVDVNAGSSLLVSAITIYSGSYYTLADNITTSALTDNQLITVDIDSAGTGAKGLKLWLEGYRLQSALLFDSSVFVTGGTNIVITGPANEPTISLDESISINGLIASGTSNFTGIIQSGGTDLYNIFLTANDGNDITRVQPGTNISTGGTDNYPTINLNSDISLTSLSASTIYSGSTNLYDIFLSPGAIPISGVTGLQDALDAKTDFPAWIELVVGTSSTPVFNVSQALGDVYDYLYNGDTITYYRYIANDNSIDAFYSGFTGGSGGTLSGLIRTKNITL